MKQLKEVCDRIGRRAQYEQATISRPESSYEDYIKAGKKALVNLYKDSELIEDYTFYVIYERSRFKDEEIVFSTTNEEQAQDFFNSHAYEESED